MKFLALAIALLSGCAHRYDPVPCSDGCGGYWIPSEEDPQPWGHTTCPTTGKWTQAKPGEKQE